VDTRALQARATSRPPPKATPEMAATVGLGPSSRMETKASLILLSIPPPPEALTNWLMSNPAQNLPEERGRRENGELCGVQLCVGQGDDGGWGTTYHWRP
jgi:hypothetical protein